MKLDDNTMEVPVGWCITNIGKLAEVIMGQSPPSATYNYDKNGLPFFQGKAEFTGLHPAVNKWCNKPNKIALANDILGNLEIPAK